MKSIGKKIKKKIFKLLSGREAFQHFFEKMHELSLAGLNFGGGDNIKYSGEKNVIDYLARHHGTLTPPVIFDVGANIGNYTLELLSVFKDNARIYSFEPLKEAFAKLAGNTKGHPNVRIYNFGFGEKAGQLTIYADKEDSTLGSVFQRRMSHLGVDASYREDVSIRTIDDFCKESNISRIDLLKIDVEGNEFNVLKGAKSLLEADAVGLIQFEFGGFNIASRTFFQDFFYLLSPHFKLYRVLKDGLATVDSYKEVHEVFMTTIYLAVSRKEVKP